MNIKKYYINYGGSIAEDVTVVSIETLPIAKAIYEFKAGYHAMTLLPKANQQLAFNKQGAKIGAFDSKDSEKRKMFSTSDSTKTVIVIYKNDTNFLPIFVDPKYESGMKIKMALGQMSEADMNLIQETLDSVRHVIESSEHDIVVVNSDLSVNLLSENELHGQFYKYYEAFTERKTYSEKLRFLFDKMEDEKNLFKTIEKREEILMAISDDSYLKFFTEFKTANPSSKEKFEERSASVIRKALANERSRCNTNILKLKKSLEQIQAAKNYRLDKATKESERIKIHSDYQKGFDSLNSQIDEEKKKPVPVMHLKNEFNDILKITVDYDGTQKNFKELDNIIYSLLYKDQNESSQIGTEFEMIVEELKYLQQQICSVTGIEITSESQFFFTHTHGTSDIDMAIV